MCRRIGQLGAALIPTDATVCTVCNAGALATGGIGTALAPIYTLHEAGRAPHVIVPETRPLLQGSRLTAWELNHAGVSCTLISPGFVDSDIRRRRNGRPGPSSAMPHPISSRDTTRLETGTGSGSTTKGATCLRA